MSKVLKIEEDYLKELISYSSKSLVGKIMKRFEILENKLTIQKESKELIYEEFRQLRDLVIAYDKGFTLTQFNFKSKKDLTP